MKVLFWIVYIWAIQVFTDATFTDICGNNLELTGTSGYLISPNHPYEYPYNKLCTKTISPSPGKIIRFTFLKFNLEADSKCRYDYLVFAYGEKQHGPLCGNSIPGGFETVETVTITFISDAAIRGTGFNVSWDVGEANCELDYEPTFRLGPNGHSPKNIWTSGYTGSLYFAHFNRDLTEVAWTIDYNNKTLQETLNTNNGKWNDKFYSSGPFYFQIYEQRNGDTPYSYFSIFSDSEEEVTTMTVTFSANSLSCSINNIQFIDCQTDYPLSVGSTTVDHNYESKGVFRCPEDSTLFPINTNPNTTCMNNAKWKSESDFKCYKAPNDTHIVGNLTVKENDEIEVFCKFTQTEPVANKYNLSFGGEIVELDVDEPFTRNITIDDDGKEIWCQPISSYTETPQFSQEGRSPNRTLHVLFSPRSVGNTTHECDWTIGKKNSCSFTFLSNPFPDQTTLFAMKNESANLDKYTPVQINSLSKSHGNQHTFTIVGIKMDDLVSQTFQLILNSSQFPNTSLNIQFELNVMQLTTETNGITISNFIWIYIGIGSGVVILVVILVAVICRRRNNVKIDAEDFGNGEVINVTYTADVLENGEKVNPVYESDEWEVSDAHGGRGETYNSITNDVTGNATTSHVYDLSDDENLYDKVADDGVYETPISFKENSTEKPSLNNPQELYATVDNEKNQPLQDSPELYAVVNKEKKKTNKTQESPELYAVVDKNKKKKPVVQESSELYAVVDKNKKKKKATQESSELYAVVNKKTK